MNETRLHEWAERHGGGVFVQECGLSGMAEDGPMVYYAVVRDLQPEGDFDPEAYGSDREEACHNLILFLKQFGIWWTTEAPQE